MLLGALLAGLCLAACRTAEPRAALKDATAAAGGVRHLTLANGTAYLRVEALTDTLLHFEAAPGPAPAEAPIPTTPMVSAAAYPGPTAFAASASGFETAAVRLTVELAGLCAEVSDKQTGALLQRACAAGLDQTQKQLVVTSPRTTNVYGLGQAFGPPGTANGDRLGRRFVPGPFGNEQRNFSGGADGYTTFPVFYALATGLEAYGMFLDQAAKMSWDFTRTPWTVTTAGDALRWYVFTGPTFQSLRRTYMGLTGRPPVPPRSMFGLWVSQYGYGSWDEVKADLASLRAAQFPVDGFCLDLMWFGEVAGHPETSTMGTLSWDLGRFPAPAQQVRSFHDDDGISLMLIEESYVSNTLPEFATLAARQFLARDCATCGPTQLDAASFWGRGGMLDWTNAAAGDFWHDLKRQPLVDIGVHAHWTDLGEPELYSPTSWYAGLQPGKHTEADVHNLFNFAWLESIQRGYARHQVHARPYLMSRSGTSGIQRFGAGMWSGDIGANMGALTAHLNSHMHMALSGIDYYSADVGGHRRDTLDGDVNVLYTQWLANASLFDVPVRPHPRNLDHRSQTAPSKIGDVPSNLANIRQRYALAPYLYSLAHRAAADGDPVYPPLAYEFQADAAVRQMGSEIMIGPSLLAAVAAGYGETDRSVYLPAGRWVNFHSLEWVASSGAAVAAVPEVRDGLFRLPLFARAGAIIPMALVDEQTMNMLGKRLDGSRAPDLRLRVVADPAPSSFTVFEDDGETDAYLQGQLAKTTVTQSLAGGVETVTIAPTVGAYEGAPTARDAVVELVTDAAQATAVTLNGAALPALASAAALAAAPRGWLAAAANLVVIKAGVLDVGVERQLKVTLAASPAQSSALFTCAAPAGVPGLAVFLEGSLPELGAAGHAPVPLTQATPTLWTQVVGGLPPGQAVTWRCLGRRPNADDVRGGDAQLQTAASGYSGKTTGRLSL